MKSDEGCDRDKEIRRRTQARMERGRENGERELNDKGEKKKIGKLGRKRLCDKINKQQSCQRKRATHIYASKERNRQMLVLIAHCWAMRFKSLSPSVTISAPVILCEVGPVVIGRRAGDFGCCC